MKYLLPLHENYNAAWHEACLWFGSLLLDRTNTVNDFGFDYHTLTPIPDNTSTDKTFADCCGERATHIFNESDRDVLLLWSGGIDSTAALVALLACDKHFFVTISAFAAQEYPKLYRDLITCKYAKITPVQINRRAIARLSTQFNIVTGELADQLFGSDTMFRDNIRSQLTKPASEVLPENIITLTANQIAQLPIDITTTADYLWWLNFSMKYQYVQFRTNYQGLDPRLNCYHFFCDGDLDRWAISNRELNKQWITNNNNAQYKQEAKNYIYDELQDADYRDNKLKQWSLRNLTDLYKVVEPVYFESEN